MTAFQRKLLWGSGLAALALRLSLALWASPGGRLGVLDDDGYFFALGRSLAAGGGYVSDGLRAFRPPLFPLFLGGFFTVFGEHLMLLRLVLAALSMAVPFAVFWLARRWWSAPTAVAAFLWASFHPHFLHYAFRLQNDSFFLLFAGWAGALMSAAAGPGSVVAAGLLTGLATLGRSQFAGAAGVGVLCLFFFPRAPLGRGAAFLFLAGFLAVMSPWWVRNFQVFGRFVPFSTEGGYTLWVGNNPLADGGGDCPVSPVPPGLDELAWDRWHYREALSYIGAHPGRTAALAVDKLSRFWAVVPRVGGAMAKAVSFFSFIPLFFAAVWAAVTAPAARRCAALPVLGLCLYYTAVESVFPAVMRYRLPLEVLLIAWGAGIFDLHRRGGAS